MNKMQEKKMTYYVVFLCFVIFVNNKCLCITVSVDEPQKFFPSINITIAKDKGNLFVLSADSINDNYYNDVLDITIENQNVTVLKKGTFEDLPKLESIKIRECGLEEIEPDAFGYLPQFNLLNLNFNHLTTLKSGIFKGLNITTHLYLVGNAISTIEKGALADLLYLEVLDLSRNKISTLQPDMFKGITNLRQLNLNFNKIETIHYNVFDYVFSNVSPGEDSFLDLSDNLLNHIDRKSLKGIYNLGRLDLKNNNLEQLESTIFDEINSLDVLDLENNNLKELKSNILERLTHTSEINLAANPWNCDFVKRYDAWCSRYHKTNTIDYVILRECHIS